MIKIGEKQFMVSADHAVIAKLKKDGQSLKYL